MALCQLQSRPDMYGLGIRVAFYIQWFGAALMTCIDEADLSDIRLFGIILSAAITLAMIVQAANNSLRSADIYITLLLAAGIYLPLVPIYIWKGFTLCHPYWNPLRYSREQPPIVFLYFNFVLLASIASIGIWFYTSFIPSDMPDCDQYGFFFGKVSFDNQAYVAFNAILYIVIILVCVGILIGGMGCKVSMWEREKHRRRVRHPR